MDFNDTILLSFIQYENRTYKICHHNQFKQGMTIKITSKLATTSFHNCNGLSLHIVPDEITSEAKHLNLQKYFIDLLGKVIKVR